jgi:hypothetical protein
VSGDVTNPSSIAETVAGADTVVIAVNGIGDGNREPISRRRAISVMRRHTSFRSGAVPRCSQMGYSDSTISTWRPARAGTGCGTATGRF